MFCAQTTKGGLSSRLEKGKVENYLQEICIGSQCLRSNLDLLQKRHISGVFLFGNVDKLEENLEEAYAICDDTIDSLIELHMAVLAQGVPYDLEFPDEDFNLFEGAGTGEIIASIRLFLQNQESATAFYSRIIDEWNFASRGNNSKGQIYLNEFLLGTNKLEQTLEDVIKNMDESLSLTFKAHCGAVILSLKHFHMSLVGKGV
jgi:hypothetical protein